MNFTNSPTGILSLVSVTSKYNSTVEDVYGLVSVSFESSGPYTMHRLNPLLKSCSSGLCV